jgi:hypothetical protein
LPIHFSFRHDEAALGQIYVDEDSLIKSTVTLPDTLSGPVEMITFELFGQEFKAISSRPLCPIAAGGPGRQPGSPLSFYYAASILTSRSFIG